MAGLVSITEIKLETGDRQEPEQDDLRAYQIVSTAKVTVEESPDNRGKPSEGIRKIVDYILSKKAKYPEATIDVIVQIHGYNTGKGYKKDYKRAREEIARIQEQDKDEKHIVIFLGYAWPSEKLSLFRPVCRSLDGALNVLPGWLKTASCLGLIGILMLLLRSYFPPAVAEIGKYFTWIEKQNDSTEIALKAIVYFVGFVLTTAILFVVPTIVLILMRMSLYFRDSYRATNYGVPDLVQFFRAFEYVLLQQQGFRNQLKGGNRIKLSFIGHSMGGFVTTNLVRILSDVFDNINPNDTNQSTIQDEALLVIDGERVISGKRSSVGQCFFLERLVLVSPDIPVNAILSGRSNFLSSSLSRFQESYLFSNEGDMVLLLLSTVANYISFPSSTGLMGYKLGNIGIKKDMKKGEKNTTDFAMSQFSRIVDEKDMSDDEDVLLKKLVIGVKHHELIEIRDELPFIAQEFTYFDCTDYLRCELSNKKENFRKYKALKLLNYASLVRYIGGTHGGYFDLPETKEAIYTLACKGFKYFQESTVTGDEIIKGTHGIKILKAKDFPR
jgi:hypothetical protein